MNVLGAIILLVATTVGFEFCGFGQQPPEWFAKPSSLSAPSGPVVRAASADEILAGGEQLTKGGTLLIEPGTYILSRPLVLRRKQDVTIRSVSGEPGSVTLQGQGWDRGNDHDDILRIADCSGVLVAGLTFANCRSYGIKVEAEHGPRNVRIHHCRFRDIGVRAIKGSAGRDPNVRAVGGSVRFCDFENTKVPPAEWLFGGDYISGIDMMALDGWTFSDNVFRNIRGRNGGGRAAIFIWVRSRRVVVERNWILNCDRGISFGNPGQSTANEPGAGLKYVSDAVIQNNWIAGGADCGIELWHVEGIQVLHNSIWRPESNWRRGIRVGEGTTKVEVVNNLVHGGIPIEGGAANVHDNLAGRLDGVFTSPSAGDLTLTSTSAANEARDRGVRLTDAPYDIRGFPRGHSPDLGALEDAATSRDWIEPMKKVHSRFRGTPGSFAQFGDSITYSGAFWSAMAVAPRGMSPATQAAYHAVTNRMIRECWKRKGPSYGNQGSMTIRWARENVAAWLATLNPEVAVILFGSNDIAQRMSIEEHERTTREVVSACLANGTVVLLTTPPPQSGRLPACLEFAAAIRGIARDLKVPLVDYCHEILARRPFDWDGAAAEFSSPEGVYDVPTLISKDGVHPSNPRDSFNDFSEEALSKNGYGLRNHMTLLAYADLIQQVLAADSAR